jgi:hypothetical protein
MSSPRFSLWQYGVIGIVGLLAVLLSASVCAMGQTNGATSAPVEVSSKVVICSPAPCVVPPTQASEGGYEVADAPIMADPLDPASLLLGSIDFNCELGIAFFSSSDGGSSWNRTCPVEGIGSYFPSDEPMVGYDRKGVGYIAAIYMQNGYNFGLVGIQSSTDGVSWSQPVTALKEGSFPAEPWLAIDTNIGSPYLNSLYISAVTVSGRFQDVNRLYVSHSNDGGATWQQVAVAPSQVFPKFDACSNLAIGKDGTLYLTWMYCDAIGSGYCGSQETAYMVLSTSKDGGNTWSSPKLMATVTLLPGLLPNTNIGITNYPVIGVDNSNGPHAGDLYVVMYNWTGTYMRVQVVRSTDGGGTWSKPVPVAPPSDTHDQFFPWLSVSSTGLVGVSWLDRRNDPANIDYQAFAAISSDGGQTFPNVQLTTAFSNPNVNGYEDNAWMGNYTGNTWDGPNYFIAAWMDSSNGVDMQDVVGGIRLK